MAARTFFKALFLIIIMARQKKMRIPASQGGLVNYYEDQTALININPKTVVILCIFVAVAAVSLRFI